MDGLSELVHSATTSNFASGKADFDLENPPENPDRYLQLRNSLIQTVRRFLEENSVCTPELKARFRTYDSQWEARALWKNEILLELPQKHAIRWTQTHSEFEKMEEGRKWLEQQYHELRQWCSEQERINWKASWKRFRQLSASS